jgi:hypothetical protein
MYEIRTRNNNGAVTGSVNIVNPQQCLMYTRAESGTQSKLYLKGLQRPVVVNNVDLDEYIVALLDPSGYPVIFSLYSKTGTRQGTIAFFGTAAYDILCYFKRPAPNGDFINVFMEGYVFDEEDKFYLSKNEFEDYLVGLGGLEERSEDILA